MTNCFLTMKIELQNLYIIINKKNKNSVLIANKHNSNLLNFFNLYAFRLTIGCFRRPVN